MLLTILFFVLLFAVFGGLLRFSLKAAWGITKILLTIVLLPVILIGLVIGGLISIAFPLLILIAIAALFLVIL